MTHLNGHSAKTSASRWGKTRPNRQISSQSVIGFPFKCNLRTPSWAIVVFRYPLQHDEPWNGEVCKKQLIKLMSHVDWGNSSPSLPRLEGVSSSQSHSSVGIDAGLQLLFPWSSSSTVSRSTFVYSFRLRWSSSSDGSDLNSSSTLSQLSFVLLRTNDRRLAIRQGGGSKIGVCNRFKLKLTNSILGICDKILKTCWIRKKRKSFQSIFTLDALCVMNVELGQCHLTNGASQEDFSIAFSPHSNFPICFAPNQAP